MRTIETINAVIMALFFLCYSYQFYYVAVALLRRRKFEGRNEYHRIAVLIAARNEENVIGQLLDSIRAQTYPMDRVDIFVGADNCTDDTAGVARAHGATVYERFNTEQVGKGYVLNELLQRIKRPGHRHYDAYLVLDADNILDPNFISEIEKVYSAGYEIVTCYRNSKNYGDNWISAGYAVWFLREAKFLSQARLTLNTSCAISGTGFFIAAHVLKESGGWKWHLLTEDIEFSASSIIEGRRIAYCPTAMLYDEQPITFIDSWNQRFRWAKGFYQVFWHYAGKLFKGIFTNPKGKRFACYDMLMTIAPAMLLTIISIGFNGTIALLAIFGVISAGTMITSALSSMFFCLFNFMLFMFIFGVLTTFTEWDNIHSTTAKKIGYLFTFPIFQLTYIPIALVALVKKASWKPIAHTISVDVEEMSQTGMK